MKHRDPDAPYTATDLCRVTGWSRPTVYAAIESGHLPGYRSGPNGKYMVPAQAFRALCDGTWKPQPREITITNINPIRTITRKRAS